MLTCHTTSARKLTAMAHNNLLDLIPALTMNLQSVLELPIKVLSNILATASRVKSLRVFNISLNQEHFKTPKHHPSALTVHNSHRKDFPHTIK
jgi:hypothetical protein